MPQRNACLSTLSSLVALLFLTLGTPALAAAGKAPAGPSANTRQVPTTITASSMEYDATGQQVVFLGNVHVKRTDFELWADKMTVYLDKSGQTEKKTDAGGVGGMEAGDIDRIVAEKNVRMKSEDKKGTCDKATYLAKEEKFIMEGSPVLRDNKNSSISGGKIVHFLSTNRSQVLEGGTAVFYAPDKTERLTPDIGSGRKK